MEASVIGLPVEKFTRSQRARRSAEPVAFRRTCLLLGLLLAPIAQAQVAALGRLEPLHGTLQITAPVTPEATGGQVLARLEVERGDDVKAGDLLAVTETAALMQALVEEVRAEAAHQRRMFEAAESQAKASCVQADVAEREAQRRASLHARNLSSAEEAERARGESAAYQASCAASKASASAAEAGISVVEARLRRVEASLERSFVRAPVDGRVIEVHARPGEMIGAQGILELGRVDQMYAIAEVYETDIGKVSAGQTATVNSRALAQPLTGVVERVRPQVRKQDQMGTDPAARKDARIVEVEIRLQDSAPAAALTNLQVEITIAG